MAAFSFSFPALGFHHFSQFALLELGFGGGVGPLGWAKSLIPPTFPRFDKQPFNDSNSRGCWALDVAAGKHGARTPAPAQIEVSF